MFGVAIHVHFFDGEISANRSVRTMCVRRGKQ